MENLICLDSSPLIDHFRKKNKENTFFYRLTKTYEGFVLHVTAHFEILIGSSKLQDNYWKNLFDDLLIIPYQPSINSTAIKITNDLKTIRKSIDFRDLMIEATAIHYNYRLATLNEKHFNAIEGLKLITPSSL